MNDRKHSGTARIFIGNLHKSWISWIPATNWLRHYHRKDLRADLLGGLTLSAFMIPAAIGDATLAKLPPQTGLYACMFSGLVYWMFTSSRHATVTVTSALSLMVGLTLAPMAHGDGARFAALATGTAFLTGIFSLIAYLIRAGGVVNFISESVLIGFRMGVVFILTLSQIPKLCGFEESHGPFWDQLFHTVTQFDRTHYLSLGVGLGALLTLALGRLFFRRRPVAFLVLVVAMVAAAHFNLGAQGVRLLGDVPPGIPSVEFPWLSLSDWNRILPLSVACFLLGATETTAIGRTLAARRGERFDANQEALALAAGNLAAGLGQGYPVSGGLSQSLVNESAGSRTPLSGLLAALVLLIAGLYLTPVLSYLPRPILAAIVIVAVHSIFRPSDLVYLWRTDREEFTVALVALVGVLCLGVLQGILMGSLLSLLMLTRKTAKPHVAVLGRIPGTQRFSDLLRHGDNEIIPGVLIVRPEAALVYFNGEYIRDQILLAVHQSPDTTKLVICDLSASPRVDIQSARILGDLHGELAAQGIQLRLVEALASVRDTLRNQGLEEIFGRIDRFTSVADAVDRFVSSGSQHLNGD